MAKDIVISLDRTRSLRFDVNALADAEDALGKSLSKALSADAGFREIRALLWAALRRDDRSLTIERVGDILQEHIEKGGSLEDVGEKLGETIKASGLFKTEGDEGNG